MLRIYVFGLTVLMLLPSGVMHGAETNLLHEFAGGVDDGEDIRASLTLGGSTLFGTTYSGGDSNLGTIFSIGTDGNGYTVLHEFVGGDDDGARPEAGLTLSGSTLFGTTNRGGGLRGGTVFTINSDGSGFAFLHEFPDSSGGDPIGELTRGGSTLYGVRFGGKSGPSTIYSLNTDGSSFDVLHVFDDATTGIPRSGLVLNGSTLYGTNSGDLDSSFIYSIDTSGDDYGIVYEFDDGSGLSAPLTTDGSKLYGVTRYGGSLGKGTIFSISIDGSDLAILHDFDIDDGAYPESGVTLSGSTLYGTSRSAGDHGRGAIYSINTDGSAFTMLHSFAGGVDDGFRPTTAPTVGGSTLYGTTSLGGDNNLGTVFSIELPEPGTFALLVMGVTMLFSRLGRQGHQARVLGTAPSQ